MSEPRLSDCESPTSVVGLCRGTGEKGREVALTGGGVGRKVAPSGAKGCTGEELGGSGSAVDDDEGTQRLKWRGSSGGTSTPST